MNRLFRAQLILTGWIAGMIPLSPLDWLAAQESADKRLDRARLIERAEQDLAGAEQIYREVIGDSTVSEATRTHARLLLGLCLIEQGKEAEGNTFLRAAAEGEGVHAEEARSVLDGRAAARQRLETTVRRLLESIQSFQPASDALVEIGDPAVPYLLDALRTSDDHNETVTLIDALLLIGSQQVVAFVESVVRAGDVYLERMLLQRVSDLAPSHSDGAFADVVRALLPLVHTAEQKTRREIVRLAVDFVTLEELVVLATHPDTYVQRSALSQIERRGLLDNPRVMAVAQPILAGFIGSDNGIEELILREYLENDEILTTGHGKDLVLAALRARFPVSQGMIKTNVETGYVLPASDLAALCRDLGPTSGELRLLIDDLLRESSTSWNGEAVADVLSMIRLGYGSDSVPLVKWLVETAEDEHYPSIAEALPHYGENLQYILHWMGNHHPTMPALSALERSVAHPELRHRLAATHASKIVEPAGLVDFGGEEEDRTKGVHVVLDAIAAIGTGEAADALVRLLPLAPEELDRLVSSRLLDGPPAFDRALLPMLDVTQDWNTRRNTLYVLARRGIHDAESVRQALEEGIHGVDDYFAFLFSTFGDQTECRYDRSIVLEIVEMVLESKNPSSWQHLAKALRNLGESQDRIPLPMVEDLFERALENPDRESRAGLVYYLLELGDAYAAAKQDLFGRAIESGQKDLITVAIAHARTVTEDLEQVRPFLEHPDPDIARVALERIASTGESAYLSWLAAVLRHPSIDLRSVAIHTVYRIGGDEALPLIAPLRHDPDWQVRSSLYNVLGRFAAPEAADVLVEGLRDENENARGNAQASLKKIEEYYEQRRRWERLKSSFSSEDGSPEEALVRLAKGAKSKKARLAAIRSLGTLAVPETLPFLIGLMEDEDAETASAAEEAVDRINTSGIAKDE